MSALCQERTLGFSNLVSTTPLINIQLQYCFYKERSFNRTPQTLVGKSRLKKTLCEQVVSI
ncbi:MAG: hypothetical protein K0S90_491 [Enterobacteriaceae bacterium]|jgi:hypothetical protein|nr:hypothetical protein [Enterobacteriaceae bacterium]